MRRSSIVCRMSEPSASGLSDCGSAVITALRGVAPGSSSASTFSARSRVVIRPSSTSSRVMAMELTCFSRISRAASVTVASGGRVTGLRTIRSATFSVVRSLPRCSLERLRLKKRSKAGTPAIRLRQSFSGSISTTLGSMAVAVVTASPSRINPRSPKLLRGPRIETTAPLASVTSTEPRLTT